MSPNTLAAVANARGKKPEDRDYLDVALVELWEHLGDQKMRRIAAEETNAALAVTSERKHNHYFKPVPFSHVDVYRVLQLFAVTDPCLQHAVKKLLVAGGRGAGKDIGCDVQEAIDTLNRWVEMRAEESK